MRCFKLTVSYDGTGFHGWQRQSNGPTIQEELECVSSLICNQPITVHGAGRTDAGVHATGMCAHFMTTSTISCERLHKGLNSLLPSSIRITKIEEHETSFHARFQASGKTYRYCFFTGMVQSPQQRLYIAHYPGHINSQAIELCLEMVTGTHDFSSFETTGTRDKTCISGRGAVRSIFKAWLDQPRSDHYELFFFGDGFLRHMIRNLTGTLIEVGQAKRSVEEFQSILAARDRQQAGATAPPHGLTLISVTYDPITVKPQPYG